MVNSERGAVSSGAVSGKQLVAGQEVERGWTVCGLGEGDSSTAHRLLITAYCSLTTSLHFEM